MSTQRRSMTGYGAGTAETADYRVVVEMKAVNQRFLEIAPHMPRAFGAWEGDLRELIRTRVARGKLDVYVSFEDRSEKRYAVHVNEGLARAYYAALGRVARAVDAPLSDGVRMTAAYEGVITISEDRERARSFWMLPHVPSTRSMSCASLRARISCATLRSVSRASRSSAKR